MGTKTCFTCALSLFIAFSAASCGKKNVRSGDDVKNGMVTDTTANPELSVEESSDTLGAEGNIRGGEFAAQETILTINFDFDRYALSEENRLILQKNAEILKAHREWTVLVEGYCDDRGTVEYNLALGQKRAKEVRDYYVRLGVPEAAIGTISYGEEKPLCADETEDCWGRNRRAETKVRAK